MWYEAVPEMQREVWIAAAQAGDEVILVSLDCSFGGIGTMKVWGHELKLAFIVHNLVLGCEAAVREVGVEYASGLYELEFIA